MASFLIKIIVITAAPIYKSTKEIKVELLKIPNLALGIFGKSGKIYVHSLLIHGILNRTYELTDTAIWAIDNNRPHTVANMLRALIETLGFSYNALENMESKSDPKTVHNKILSWFFGSRQKKSAFTSVNILTCIDKAKKMFPELRNSYDDLSEVVHPNSKSFSYSGKTSDKAESGTFELMIPFYDFKEGDREKITNQVGECCYYIQSICKEILSNSNNFD